MEMKWGYDETDARLIHKLRMWSWWESFLNVTEYYDQEDQKMLTERVKAVYFIA
jgi:hypothetical protein